MAQLGVFNQLRVLRTAPQGFYLDGENLGDILLPARLAAPGTQPDDLVDVFVHRDSDDRLLATTQKPLIQAGGFACLEVVDADERHGAFLDWGLDKDLFLPRRSVDGPLNKGDRIVVHALVDVHSQRIVASAHVSRFLDRTEPTYRQGEKVDLLILAEHDLGYVAIVENAHKGLLYHTDIRSELYYGQRLDGYVKLVREDGKIDLALDPAGYSRVAPLADRIIEKLKASGGRLPYDDSSRPEDIRAEFGASKKSFKQAIGSLFKERKIMMLEHGIALKAKE